jgi:signal transduction histidine kinase
MFKRLSLPARFATLGALLFLVAGTVFTYLDYRLAIERMEAMGERANAIAIRTLWQHIEPVALPLFGVTDRGPAVRGINDLIIGEIERQASKILQNTDIDKIKIFDADGYLIYSTNTKQIGVDEVDNPNFLQAMTGAEVFTTERYNSLVTVHGLQHNVVMQATYMPIYGPENGATPIGVFETYTNFGPTLQAAQLRAWLRIGGLTLGLAALYALLVVLVIHSDRTIRKAEEARGRALAEVVKVRAEDASKSAFLAHMSHELRTPLNAIIGFSEFIEKSSDLNLPRDKIIEYAGDIRLSAVHLLRIINDLLDLTRLDLGRIKPEVSDVDLAAIFGEAFAMVRAQAKNGNIILIPDFGGNIPLIRTDHQRVKQILINLLGNAVKFTPEGGTITGNIHIDRDRNAVALVVEDTGIGMSGDETSDRLNVLKYGDAMIAHKLSGVGLGLPLCQRYARLLGGDLRIDSALGQGTKVTLEIPLVPVDGKARAAA